MTVNPTTATDWATQRYATVAESIVADLRYLADRVEQHITPSARMIGAVDEQAYLSAAARDLGHRALRVRGGAVTTCAPDVGALFNYRGRDYVVSGWLRQMAPPEPPASERSPLRDLINEVLYETQQQVGPDRVRVVFCVREDAEYVTGRGVAGCIARVADINVTGSARWSADQLADARRQAARLVGHAVA
jgi:hypothetical protein